MVKMLLVINANKPKQSVIDFGCRMAALTKSKLTGLFIESLFSRDDTARFAGDSYFGSVAEKELDAPVKTDTDQAITWFVRECASRNVATEVLIAKGEPIQETLGESRYADLLIVDPGIDFYGDEEELPTHFTKEILAGSECPVLLAPEKQAEVEEVVFCYDGSASSVFALKQFTYLLPEYKSGRLLLLQVKNEIDETGGDQHQRMMQWLQVHYAQVDYKTLSGDAKDELFTWFFLKEKKLLVMGSYGRSALSKLFRPSAADSLIRAVDLPVFITHANY